MRYIFVVLLAVFSWYGVNQPVQAQETAAPQALQDPSPNDIRELMRLLSDERMLQWLGEKAEDVEGAETEIQTFREQLVTGLDQVKARMTALGQAWKVLPQTPKMIRSRWQEEMTQDRKVRSMTLLVIFLFVGAGLEWLYRQYTVIPLLRLTMLAHVAPGKKALTALARVGIIGVGLILFALGSVGTFLSFDWPPFTEIVILNFLTAVIALRVMGALTMFVLAPKTPDLRLVPLSNQMVKHFHLMFALAAGVVVYAFAAADVFSQITELAGDNEDSAALSIEISAGAVVALVLLAVNYWSFRLWRQVHGTKYFRGRINWCLYVYVLIIVTFLLWVTGTGPLMWSVLAIGALFPVIRLLHGWVDYFFDQATEAALQEQSRTAENELAQKPDQPEDAGLPEEEAQPQGLMERAENRASVVSGSIFRLVFQRVLRFVAVVAAAIFVMSAWGIKPGELSDASGMTGKVVSVILDTIFVLLIADLVWTWAKTTIDKRLAAYVPPEDGQAPGPEARMATLLPLLRMVLLVTLLIMIVFSILSSLGINIAPLIAGAGVLGIAIGFGAQALVRDIVSGVFFLIDDAFRIGEYIEIGELRGTVEGISIRSLRVRHHRGAIHTIPFGELKSLTNHSRDWVIMKLEFRVPFETDLQLVKKLVKKVGAELKANEFYGGSILSTLKSQGVRRMEEFNMVVGVKFMTKPGEQWLVRRDAYQKVRDIFEANGIRMAERNVKVEIQGGDELSDEERQAVAGAAQEATQGPKLPPGPVPDEP